VKLSESTTYVPQFHSFTETVRFFACTKKRAIGAQITKNKTDIADFIAKNRCPKIARKSTALSEKLI
jgi:hypothetical protein